MGEIANRFYTFQVKADGLRLAKVMHVRPAGLCLWDQPDLYRGFIATIEHKPTETE